jgi:hypothetical protein
MLQLTRCVAGKDISKPIDFGAAFLFEVSGSNLPLVAQELQIARMRVATLTLL